LLSHTCSKILCRKSRRHGLINLGKSLLKNLSSPSLQTSTVVSRSPHTLKTSSDKLLCRQLSETHETLIVSGRSLYRLVKTFHLRAVVLETFLTPANTCRLEDEIRQILSRSSRGLNLSLNRSL